MTRTQVVLKTMVYEMQIHGLKSDGSK